MGAFDSIFDLINNFGTGMNKNILGAADGTTLYAIYFIAFLGIFYWLIYTGINRGRFEGKPAKMISIFASIIVIGSIFFKYKSADGLINAMTSFGVCLLTIAAAIAIAICGIAYFNNNKEKHHNFSFFILFLSLLIFSSLMQPMFKERNEIIKTDITRTSIGNYAETWMYEVVIQKHESLKIIGDILGWVFNISLIMTFWYTFKLFLGLGGSGITSIKESAIGQKLAAEAEATTRMKTLIKNLHNQLEQGKKIVGNFKRFI